jgi:hypothetical protein
MRSVFIDKLAQQKHGQVMTMLTDKQVSDFLSAADIDTEVNAEVRRIGTNDEIVLDAQGSAALLLRLTAFEMHRFGEIAQ